MVGFVRAYLRAAADLEAGGFQDPETQAIIEEYTGVPGNLVAAAVPPDTPQMEWSSRSRWRKLQTFFRERGQLEYENDIDPVTVIDPTYAERATGGSETGG
jgi:NitT/TauT family transport system substrate-binding protein